MRSEIEMREEKNGKGDTDEKQEKKKTCKSVAVV